MMNRNPTLMWLVRLMTLSACALLAGCSNSEKERRESAPEAHMDTSSTERVYCTGRFRFIAPEEMDETGRGQSMYRTNIKTIPVPPGGVEAYWKVRLAQIGPVQPRRFEFQPDVRSAWSARNATFPNILTLEMVKPVSGGLLFVDREADAGKENLAETLVKDLVNSYVLATDRGFCVGNGAITLEPSQNEQARLSLAPKASPDIEIRLATRTVGAPDVKTYSDVDEERGVTSAAGGTLSVLRDQERSGAGLSGKEIRISAVIPGEKPSVRFTWHYPGAARSSTKPSINVVGTAPVDKQKQLEAIWETVMTSLRTIPLSPPPPK